jgi:hypothetical protein
LVGGAKLASFGAYFVFDKSSITIEFSTLYELYELDKLDESR